MESPTISSTTLASPALDGHPLVDECHATANSCGSGDRTAAGSQDEPQLTPPRHSHLNETSHVSLVAVPSLVSLPVAGDLSCDTDSSSSPSVDADLLRAALTRELAVAKEENQVLYMHATRCMIDLQEKIDTLTRENVALIRALTAQTNSKDPHQPPTSSRRPHPIHISRT